MHLIPAKYLSNLRQVAPLSLLLLAACSSGGGDTAPPPLASSFTIGGTVTGLTGSGLVLRNNGGDDLPVAANSTTYTFSTSVANGGSYNVTVLTQPAGQLCTVANASGANLAANVTNANVTCVAAFTIGGVVNSSFAGIGPTLQNNGGDNLFIPAIIAGSTPFTFATPVASGGTYAVTQLSKASAPTQNCVVSGGAGPVNSDINSVVVTCTPATPIPRFAYVTNGTANTVSGYSIDFLTGALAAIGTPVATGTNPHAVAVEPGGRFAYVANTGAASISVYSISTAAPVGGLTALADADAGTPGVQPSIATGNEPFSITIHPSGKFAYVVHQAALSSTGNSISVYSIDVTTGALAAIDADSAMDTQAIIATGTKPYAVVVDPTGKFAYAANDASNDVSVYTINQTTGALTQVDADGVAAGIQNFAAGTNPRSVAIDPAGKCALVANGGSDNVTSHTINVTTGALSPAVSTVPGALGSAPRSVAIDPATGSFAYAANAGSASVSAFSVNPATCAIASIDSDAVVAGVNTTIPAGTGPVSVNVDPSGKYVYVANGGSDNVSAFSIGTGGALTLILDFAAGTGPNSVTTTQ